MTKKKFLISMSEFFIRRRWFQNGDKFKPGDKVVYNWKAKATLGKSAEKGIFTIKSVEKHRDDDGANCSFFGYSFMGADVYWLRKARFWELKTEMKIFQFSEYDWFAGESLEECKRLAIEMYDHDDDYFDEARQITEAELDSLIFVEDFDEFGAFGNPPENKCKTFRNKLGEMIFDGDQFPTLFASSEY